MKEPGPRPRSFSEAKLKPKAKQGYTFLYKSSCLDVGLMYNINSQIYCVQ